MSVSLLALVGRNFGLNCILKHELRRYDSRSRFPKKSPFRPPFGSFYLHPAHGSSLRVSKGSCGMPSLRRCPLANWPRISSGNWAPPPKEQKGQRQGPPTGHTLWFPGLPVPFRASLSHPIQHGLSFCACRLPASPALQSRGLLVQA